jgi:hypothetical protein
MKAGGLLLSAVLVVVAGHIGGCNQILGVEKAEADPAPTEGSLTRACQQGSGECMACVADKCCQEFDDCHGDSACSSEVGKYNACLLEPADAGVACFESLGETNPKASVLAQCLIKSCRLCDGQVLGAECEEYCSCMATACSDKTFEAGSCLAACATYTPSQLNCRNLHCHYAAGDPSGTSPMHCGHAVGIGACEN